MQRLLFFTLTFLCGVFYATAQETKTSTIEEILILSNRIEADQYESGKDITVIDAKQIAQIGATSIDQLLRYVQGVEVQPRGAFGVQSDISMRATTFSQVIILIDGMKLNDPLTGHFNCNIPIPINQIEKIEILRGAASAQYGADAVGGIINIITKSRSNTSKSTSTIELGTGDYNLFFERANSFTRKNKISFEIGADGAYSKGPKPQGINNKFAIVTLSAGLSINLGKNSTLFYRTAYDFRDFNAKYFYTKSPADNAKENTQNAWNQVGFKKTAKKSNTQIDFVWRYNYDSYQFNPSLKANVHYTNFYNLQAYQNHTINKIFKFTTGIQADVKTIRSNDRGNHQNYHIGIFAGVMIKPINSFIINFNHRLDYDKNYKLQYSPHLSLAFNKKYYTIRANGGKAVRAADFTERYISSNLTGPLSAGRNLGNPDLKTETFWNIDGGIDIKPIKGMVFSVTAFSRWGRNQIDYVITNSDELTQFTNTKPNTNYYFAKNIKAVNTRGFEIGYNYKKDFAKNSFLILNTGYIYAFSKTTEGALTKYISNHARHLLTYNIQAKISMFNIGISGLYKYRLPDALPSLPITTNEYALLNINAGLNLAKDKLALNLHIDNLFNRQYTEVLGAQQPGRWAYISLAYRF
jgi:iron complex outermembrane receptor protein